MTPQLTEEQIGVLEETFMDTKLETHKPPHWKFHLYLEKTVKKDKKEKPSDPIPANRCNLMLCDFQHINAAWDKYVDKEKTMNLTAGQCHDQFDKFYPTQGYQDGENPKAAMERFRRQKFEDLIAVKRWHAMVARGADGPDNSRRHSSIDQGDDFAMFDDMQLDNEEVDVENSLPSDAKATQPSTNVTHLSQTQGSIADSTSRVPATPLQTVGDHSQHDLVSAGGVAYASNSKMPQDAAPDTVPVAKAVPPPEAAPAPEAVVPKVAQAPVNLPPTPATTAKVFTAAPAKSMTHISATSSRYLPEYLDLREEKRVEDTTRPFTGFDAPTSLPKITQEDLKGTSVAVMQALFNSAHMQSQTGNSPFEALEHMGSATAGLD
ncbi:hypothetical protein BDZ45DRAFT_432232 [Acephala macrosclerotiorum]|nr:hypothetical protein BDZ45DRAFT_432232 [Acephala macrosclerotiorum]